MLKNWCFGTVVLEKTLESPLDCKKIQPVHLKGNQSQIFTGKTDVEAETPVLWPPDGKNWPIGKDSDAGKYWRQKGEGGNRGWDGWMTSPTRWTWIWGSFWSWWWTGKPGVLQSMKSQRVGHDWATELKWYIASYMVKIQYTLIECNCITLNYIMLNYIKLDPLIIHGCLSNGKKYFLLHFSWTPGHLKCWINTYWWTES